MLVSSDKYDTRSGIQRFPLEACILFLVYIYNLVKCLYAAAFRNVLCF